MRSTVTASRMIRRPALAALVVLVAVGAAWGQDAAAPAKKPGSAVGIPPALQVGGTLVMPERKAALIVVLDGQGKETGSFWVNEGDVVQGYRVLRIEADRVSLLRDGETLVVYLGRTAGRGAPSAGAPTAPLILFRPAGSGEEIVPDLPYKGRREGPPETLPAGVVPGEEIETDEEVSLDALGQDPQFREQLEEMRTLLRQRLLAPPASPPAE